MRILSQSRNASSIHTVQVYEICTLLELLASREYRLKGSISKENVEARLERVVILHIGTVTMSAQEALALLRAYSPIAEVKIDISSCANDIIVDEEAKLITLCA